MVREAGHGAGVECLVPDLCRGPSPGPGSPLSQAPWGRCAHASTVPLCLTPWGTQFRESGLACQAASGLTSQEAPVALVWVPTRAQNPGQRPRPRLLRGLSSFEWVGTHLQWPFCGRVVVSTTTCRLCEFECEPRARPTRVIYSSVCPLLICGCAHVSKELSGFATGPVMAAQGILTRSSLVS